MKIQYPITITVRAIALASAFSLVGGITAQAAFTPLNPGTPEALGVIIPTATAAEILGGVVIASQNPTFADNGTPPPVNSGVLNSFVVDRGGGLLDFYYQIVNNSNALGLTRGTVDPLDDLPAEFSDIFRLKSIGGFEDEAGVTVAQTNSLAGLIGIPGGLSAPIEGFSTADRDVGSIGSIGADLSTPPAFFLPPNPSNLQPGEATSFLIIRTNANQYGNVTAQISGGGGTSLASTFAAVPEPGSMVFGLGVLGVCFLRNRKSRAV